MKRENQDGLLVKFIGVLQRSWAPLGPSLKFSLMSLIGHRVAGCFLFGLSAFWQGLLCKCVLACLVRTPLPSCFSCFSTFCRTKFWIVFVLGSICCVHVILYLLEGRSGSLSSPSLSGDSWLRCRGACGGSTREELAPRKLHLLTLQIFSCQMLLFPLLILSADCSTGKRVFSPYFYNTESFRIANSPVEGAVLNKFSTRKGKTAKQGVLCIWKLHLWSGGHLLKSCEPQ